MIRRSSSSISHVVGKTGEKLGEQGLLISTTEAGGGDHEDSRDCHEVMT